MHSSHFSSSLEQFLSSSAHFNQPSELGVGAKQWLCEVREPVPKVPDGLAGGKPALVTVEGKVFQEVGVGPMTWKRCDRFISATTLTSTFASDLLVSRDRAALATFWGSSDRTSIRRPKRRTTSANSISRATTDNEE